MAQSGGLMVPPQLAKLPSDLAREQLETDQREAMSAAQQLGWVPKLYYWIKKKYCTARTALPASKPAASPNWDAALTTARPVLLAGDIGGCDLTEDPIWLLGVCHHIRRDSSAPPPASGAFSRLNLRWRDPDTGAGAASLCPRGCATAHHAMPTFMDACALHSSC
jgi:hypothetical protein